jgi:hypothetical protein
MNSTRVWAAREARLREPASTSLLMDGHGDEQQPGQRPGQPGHRDPEVMPHLRQVAHAAILPPRRPYSGGSSL